MAGRSYGVLRSKVWDSADFRSMTIEQRLLFIYLLTNRAHSLIGAYALPLSHAETDTMFGRDQIVDMIHAMPGVTYAADVGWVVIENYLRNNPLVNDNYVEGARKLLRALPDDPTLLEAMLRSVVGVRRLDRQDTLDLERRLDAAQKRKAALLRNSLNSKGRENPKGLDVSNTSPLHPLSSQNKGLVSHAHKGLVGANANKISKILAASEPASQGALDIRLKPLASNTPGFDKGLAENHPSQGMGWGWLVKGLHIFGEGACVDKQGASPDFSSDDHELALADGDNPLMEHRESANGKGLATPGGRGAPINRLSTVSSEKSGSQAGVVHRALVKGLAPNTPDSAKASTVLTDSPITDVASGGASSLQKALKEKGAQVEIAVTGHRDASPEPDADSASDPSGDIDRAHDKGLAREKNESEQGVTSGDPRNSESSGGRGSAVRTGIKDISTTDTYVGEGVQGENLVSTRPEAGEQKSSQASPSTPEVPEPRRHTPANDRPLTGPSLPPPQGEAVGPSQPPLSFGQQRSLLGDEPGDATAPSPAQSSVEEKTSRKSSKKSVFPEDLFVPKLCALWNILVFKHGGAQMGVYNAGFENYVRARYTESQKTPYGVRSKLVTLQDWAEFFHHIARSPFLTGQLSNTNGRKPFRISMSWLMKSNENFWKVRRGEYHDRATMRDIGEFSMPDLKGINLDFRGYDA